MQREEDTGSEESDNNVEVFVTQPVGELKEQIATLMDVITDLKSGMVKQQVEEIKQQLSNLQQKITIDRRSTIVGRTEKKQSTLKQKSKRSRREFGNGNYR